MKTRKLYYPGVMDDIWDRIKNMETAENDIITKADLERLRLAVESKPYGQATIEWCCKKDTTVTVNISWYMLYRQRYIMWETAIQSRYIQQDAIITEGYSKRQAWHATFPERYEAYYNLVLRRDMAKKHVSAPKNAVVTDILDEKYGLFLIREEKGRKYLCSPIGCISVPYPDYEVYDALTDIGIDIPPYSEGLTWEDIEPMWVMAALKK